MGPGGGGGGWGRWGGGAMTGAHCGRRTSPDLTTACRRSGGKGGGRCERWGLAGPPPPPAVGGGRGGSTRARFGGGRGHRRRRDEEVMAKRHVSRAWEEEDKLRKATCGARGVQAEISPLAHMEK